MFFLLFNISKLLLCILFSSFLHVVHRLLVLGLCLWLYHGDKNVIELVYLEKNTGLINILILTLEL
jgi:hypothetical protein